MPGAEAVNAFPILNELLIISPRRARDRRIMESSPPEGERPLARGPMAGFARCPVSPDVQYRPMSSLDGAEPIGSIFSPHADLIEFPL